MAQTEQAMEEWMPEGGWAAPWAAWAATVAAWVPVCTVTKPLDLSALARRAMDLADFGADLFGTSAASHI
jgi:hypothetical protein